MKQFIILFFCASLMFAQEAEKGLLQLQEPWRLKIAFAPKKLRKK